MSVKHPVSVQSGARQYQYQPLPKSPRQSTSAYFPIRVLSLMPALSGNALIGSIHVREPDQSYEALSYCWNNSPHTFDTDVINIMENGQYYTLSIGSNLTSALRQLRHRSGENRYFWIDAICIDQASATEKSQQIPLMDRIFNEAEQVCIWLGDKGDYPSTDDHDFIREINEMQIFENLVQPKYIPHWAALSSLMRREWFKRRWVVQEIAFARQATVYWGEYQVRWTDLADAIALFGSKATAIGDLLRHDKPNQRRADFLNDVNGLSANRLVDTIGKVFRKTHDGKHVARFLSLETLMSSLTAFEASQPHDIVYAILSLAKDLIPKARNITATPQTTALGMANSPGGKETANDDARAKFSEASFKILDKTSETFQGDAVIASSSAQTKRKLDEIDDRAHSSSKIELADAKARLEQHYLASALPFDFSAMTENMSKAGLANEVVSERFWDDEAIAWLHGSESDRKRLAHRLLTYEDRFKRLVRDTLRNRVRHQYVHVDYSKKFFEVGIDFLNFVIPRSKSLDMLCRPWAPDIGPSSATFQDGIDLPSWICPLSKSPFMSLADGSSGRINGDLFVGMPDTGGTKYGASGMTEVGLKRYFFGGEQKRSLFVIGLIVDTIKEVADRAIEGNIPPSWLDLGNWPNPLESPPDDFWRTIVANRDAKGENVPVHYQRACQIAFQQRPLKGGLNVDRLIDGKFSDVMTEYLKRVQAVVWMRRLIRTEQAHPVPVNHKLGPDSHPKFGRLGLVPANAQAGDHVCILRGCTVPVIVRTLPAGVNSAINDDPETSAALRQLRFQSSASNATRLKCQLIGESYIHGLMDSEAFMLRDSMHVKDVVLELR